MNDNELADWLDYFSDLSGHKRMTEAAARLRHLAMLEDGEPMVPELLYEATFGAMEDMRAENERLRTVVGDMDAIIGDVVRERDAARAEVERLRAAGNGMADCLDRNHHANYMVTDDGWALSPSAIAARDAWRAALGEES